MLGSLDMTMPRSIAITEQGLLIDIARECQAEFGEATRLYFLCGRDAAERVLTWDYGRAGVVEEMLNQFELLVASRSGDFVPPPEFERRIHPLAMTPGHDQVSSTEVRERIARGEPWNTWCLRASSNGYARSIREDWCRETRATCGCGWDDAVCGGPWLRSGECARE